MSQQLADGSQQAAAFAEILADPAMLRNVLAELLRHEQHFWYDSARAFGLGDGQDGTTPGVLRQIVAAGCLLVAAS